MTLYECGNVALASKLSQGAGGTETGRIPVLPIDAGGSKSYNHAPIYMSSLAASLITLGCLLGGTFLGMAFQLLLPKHHLSKESQDTVKLGAGMVATMSALILGLLVSSAKSSFDNMNVSIAQYGAKIIQLDHLLAGYGPETKPLRAQMKQSVAGHMQKIWADSKTGAPGGLQAVEKSTAVLDFQSLLRELKPTNESQKSILNRAEQVLTDLWQMRLLIIEEQQQPVPVVFLALLIFWLTILFMSFGLFAPHNATVFAVLLVCALSVSSAVFLILEMSHPLDGYIRASNAPLVKALEVIGG